MLAVENVGTDFRGIATGVSWALARDIPPASTAANVKTAIEIFMDLRCPFCIFGKSIRRAPNIFGTGRCFGNYLDETMDFRRTPLWPVETKNLFRDWDQCSSSRYPLPVQLHKHAQHIRFVRDSNFPARVRGFENGVIRRQRYVAIYCH